MRPEYWERFLRHRLQRELRVSDSNMHHGMCIPTIWQPYDLDFCSYLRICWTQVPNSMCDLDLCPYLRICWTQVPNSMCDLDLCPYLRICWAQVLNSKCDLDIWPYLRLSWAQAPKSPYDLDLCPLPEDVLGSGPSVKVVLSSSCGVIPSNFSSNICKGNTINSLWPSDVIWRWRSWSTLGQIMACCLTAPSHYLNQCSLTISMVQWHLPQGVSQEIAQPSTTRISLKITYEIFHSHLPGYNELIHWSLEMCLLKQEFSSWYQG